jgi:Ca2+-binding EF-hand superfamily protein/CBS-domain-containing membrane protein
MGLSVLTEPSSPTARAAALLDGGAAGAKPMSPHLTALVAGGSAPPPSSPKRAVLTADDLEIYTGVFQKFDADASGTISASELGSVLDLLGVSVDDKTITKMMAEVDDDSSGEIDLDEFIAMMAKNVGSQGSILEGELRYAFAVLDEDGGGTISSEELKSSCEKLGEKLSPDQVAAMLALVDSDGSGDIDYDEFVSMARAGAAPPLQQQLAGEDAPADGATAPAVLRRKFRSVIRMIVLQRRIVDTFAKVNNAAYQWQRFCNIESVEVMKAKVAAPVAFVPHSTSILGALDILSSSGEVCLPVMAEDGTSVLGFIHMLDIIGFMAAELDVGFVTKIDFGQCDVARRSLSGKQHLQQAWAVAEQQRIAQAGDVLRARLTKIAKPTSRVGTVLVTEIMQTGPEFVRPCRPGFSVSDVSSQLELCPNKLVPLTGWDGETLAVISQLDLLAALAEEGCQEERLGEAAEVCAEVISEECPVAPCYTTALAAFQRLSAEDGTSCSAMAVTDEAGVLIGEIVPETAHFVSNADNDGQIGIAALSMTVGKLAATMQKSQTLPTCRVDTPLHELLNICVATQRSQVWVLDGQGRPVGMVTAAAMMAAICRGGSMLDSPRATGGGAE